MPGNIHPPSALFFRQEAGTASAPDGRSYELSTNVGNGCPIVRSHTTGKWYVLNWEDIIALAIEAGIDQP